MGNAIKWLVAIVLLAVAGVMVQKNLSERKSIDAQNEAVDAFNAGQMERAVELLEKALKTVPQTEQAKVKGLLAKALRSAADSAQAKDERTKYLQRLQEVAPDLLNSLEKKILQTGI